MNVVVIGAGGAGLTAAIEAVKSGAQVTLLAKTAMGLATCTAYSAGHFSLAGNGKPPGEHYEKTMETGKNVNDPALVRVLAEQAENAVHTLADWGVTIRFFGPGRASTRQTKPNELMGGAGFTAELVRIAKVSGVKFVEWTVVTELLTARGRICGVRCTNWRSGRAETISADAVVLAAGGGGQVYSHTDNPSRITGDGYALAKTLGLPLIDMEFVQFYPVGWADPALPAWMGDAALVDYMRITDAQGNEFFKKALDEWGYKNGQEANLFARDRCAVLMEQVNRQGGAFAHLEDVPEDMWNDKGLLYALTIDVSFVKNLKRPVRVAPLEHYMCGGVKIDAGCRTGIEGLYACGEVTGGVDGANRIGGNALASIITFGLIAGRNAAQTQAAGQTVPEKALPDAPFHGADSPKEARRSLRKKAWKCIGPLRNERGIKEMLDFLAELRAKKYKIETPQDLLLALEIPGLIETAQVVAEAALARKGSLGTHYREDAH